MRTLAFVTLTPDGKIMDTSTVTINGQTAPVPLWTRTGVRAAPPRIGQAIADLGYRAPDYYGTITDIPGGSTIEVVPA
jgi:hypothetical protein